MNSDIYERHRQAVEMWRKACDDVDYAEHERDLARNVLDKVSAELMDACQDPHKSKPIVKRGRRAKTNGVDFKGMMREQPIPGYIPEK